MTMITSPTGIARLYKARRSVLVPDSYLGDAMSNLVDHAFLESSVVNESSFRKTICCKRLASSSLSCSFVRAVRGRFGVRGAPSLRGEIRDRNVSRMVGVKGGFNVSSVGLVGPKVKRAAEMLLEEVP